MSVKFDKASVELLLFETFANFLSKIENLDENKAVYEKILKSQELRVSKKYLFYCYIGQNLLNGFSTRSVENIFSEAPIDDDRFKFFCEKFESVFERLPDAEKQRYQAMNSAFILWRNGLYEKHGWKLPIGDEKEINNQLEDNQVLSQNFTERRKSLINEISEYYKSLYLREEAFYELWTFKEWKNRLERGEEDDSRRSGDKAHVERMGKFLNNRWIEFYNMDKGQIIRRKINFEKIDPYDYEKSVYGDLYHQDKDKKAHGKFSFNLISSLLILNIFDRETNNDNNELLKGFILKLHSLLYKDTFAKGYYFEFSSNFEITFKLATARLISSDENKSLEYTVCDPESIEIPFKTKYFLTETEFNYPKGFDYNTTVPMIIEALGALGKLNF